MSLAQVLAVPLQASPRLSKRRITRTVSSSVSIPYVNHPLLPNTRTDIYQKGSVLAEGPESNHAAEATPYTVEGIGYDFIPEVLNFDDIDQWMKTGDQESFEAVQLIMRKEGLLVGGSSGSALSGALRWLKSDAGRLTANTEGANVVILLADGCVSTVDFSAALSYQSIP